jgi:ubiquinone/menaquinone biosynthesis C-methylase UbiE
MKIVNIDNGKDFDFGNTSLDYSKYRDIYPNSLYVYLYEHGIGKKNQTILDLGTGTGVLPRAMYTYGAKYTGVDISEAQIKQAIKLSKEQNTDIEYKICSAESTGLESNGFDVITAAQCFMYFDKNKILPEIKRLLKSDGKFVKIWMAWLPYENKIAEETEKIVLKYNPLWTGYGYKGDENDKTPAWSKEFFEQENEILYKENIRFTYETWIGRIRACRGVSAALPEEIVKRFNAEHFEKIKGITKEPFEIPHEIRIEIFKISRYSAR